MENMFGQRRTASWSAVAPSMSASDDDDRMANDIERWLNCSGLTEPSVSVLRPVLPRWVKFLRRHGVSRIPPMPFRDPSDTYPANLLCQLANEAKPQGERDGHKEHTLRNLTGVRPYKP